MKKIFLLIGTVLILGAGCSQPIATQTPSEGVTDHTGSTTSSPSEQPPKTPEVAVGDLKELPAIDPASVARMDESTWTHTSTRSGVTLTYPIKGAYAPTWTYTLLAKNDEHLKGNCYVTDATVYKRTNFVSFEGACLTTTTLEAGPGSRTDYFVFSDSSSSGDREVQRIHLFTFTKIYPAGFNMDDYSATIEKVVGIID